MRVLGDSQVHAIAKGVRKTDAGPAVSVSFVAPGRMIRAFMPGADDEESVETRRSFETHFAAFKGRFAVSFGGGEHAKTWSYSRAAAWSLDGSDDAKGFPVVSRPILRLYFEQIFTGFVSFLAAQSEKRGVEIALLATPPVVAENTLLIEARNKVARGARPPSDDSVISQPVVRREIWTLMEDVKTKLCASAGIPYMPPPAQSVTPDGFLKDDLVGDAFHANDDYGALVVQDLLAWKGSR